MQADYAALIEKHQLDALRMIRNAGDYAKRLLQVAPDAADAYLVLGAANYMIGSPALHKRLFLRFAGNRRDKREGTRQLEIVAARGRYLRPFAKILLALAALAREADRSRQGAADGARRGVSAQPAVCRRTGQTPGHDAAVSGGAFESVCMCSIH
jgi:hypothetical protein